jgi:hypothetical protein
MFSALEKSNIVKNAEDFACFTPDNHMRFASLQWPSDGGLSVGGLLVGSRGVPGLQ